MGVFIPTLLFCYLGGLKTGEEDPKHEGFGSKDPGKAA